MPTPTFSSNAHTTTASYTLSLHDALPIYRVQQDERRRDRGGTEENHAREVFSRLVRLRIDDADARCPLGIGIDRKSTRLNSSHGYISYAVFCLKKKRMIRVARW